MKYLFYIVIFVICSKTNSNAQSSKLDSLLKVVSKIKNDTNKVKLFSKISILYWKADKSRQSMEYAEKAFALSKKLGYKKGMSRALNGMAILHQFQGNFTESIKIYFTSLKISEEINDKSNLADVYSNIALVYDLQGENKESMKNYHKSLNLFKDLNDTVRISWVYLKIGNMFLKSEDFTNAIDNLMMAYRLFKINKNEEGLGYALQGLGNSTLYKAEKPSTSKHLHDSLCQVTLSYYFSALDIHIQNNYVAGIISGYNAIAEVFVKLGNANTAIDYLNKSKKYKLDIGNLQTNESYYKIRSDAELILGMHKSAYENYKLYIVYRDSLSNDINIKKALQAQLMFDFDKKQTADSIKNAEHSKQEYVRHQEEVKQQKIYTYGGIIGFSLMLIVAIVSFRAFRNKKKANYIISEQKRIVEEKQKEILDSIHYAKRIQNALLPSLKYIERNLRNLKGTK